MTPGVLTAAVAGCGTCAFLARAAGYAMKRGLDVRFTAPAAICALGCGLGLQILIALRVSDQISALMCSIALAAMLAGAITDAQTGYVLDVVTLPALAAIGFLSFFNDSAVASVLGAFAASGALALLFAATRGRGLGLGDVKLAACAGAALGATDGLTSLGVAFVLGGAYASYLLVTQRGKVGQTVPFAPFIASGMALVLAYRTV